MGNIIDKLTYALETKEAITQAILNKAVFVSPYTPFRDYPAAILQINGAIDATLSESGFTGDGTIIGKLRYLEETKYLIRQAIELKGVPVPVATPFRDYADLIGKIAGLVDYNGVLLPDVDPLITDEYPDAAILDTGGGVYYLYVIGGEWEIAKSTDEVTTTGGSVHKLYTTRVGSGEWTYHSSDSDPVSGNIVLRSAIYTPIWATFEIPELDGEGGETPGGDIGGGDDLERLSLPDYNKTAYQYVIIMKCLPSHDKHPDKLWFIGGTKPYVHDPAIVGSTNRRDGIRMNAEGFECRYYYDPDNGSWVYEEDEIADGYPYPGTTLFEFINYSGTSVAELMWANHDIYDENDGPLYFAKSESDPVYE